MSSFNFREIQRLFACLKLSILPKFFGGWGSEASFSSPIIKRRQKPNVEKLDLETLEIPDCSIQELFLTSEQSINLPKTKSCSWAKSSYQAGVSLWISIEWSGSIALIFIPWNNSSRMFSWSASQVHLLSYFNRFLCSRAILISLLFLPARMARTGNIFSIVAHTFWMLGEKRNQILPLALTEPNCFIFWSRFFVSLISCVSTRQWVVSFFFIICVPFSD